MNGKLKRIGLTALLAMICCLGVFALSGCGGGGGATSDEGQIKSDIDSVMKLWTGEGNIDELAAEDDILAAASVLGVEAKELAGSMLSHNAYTIKSVTVNGDTATAVLSLTALDFDALGATLETKTNELLATLDPNTSDSETLMKQYGQLVMDTINDPKAATVNIEESVDYVKKNGKWTMKDQDAFIDSVAEATAGDLL